MLEIIIIIVRDVKMTTQLNNRDMIVTNPKLLAIALEIYRGHHAISISNAGST